MRNNLKVKKFKGIKNLHAQTNLINIIFPNY